jgi:hypothetical protein
MSKKVEMKPLVKFIGVSTSTPALDHYQLTIAAEKVFREEGFLDSEHTDCGILTAYSLGFLVCRNLHVDIKLYKPEVDMGRRLKFLAKVVTEVRKVLDEMYPSVNGVHVQGSITTAAQELNTYPKKGE